MPQCVDGTVIRQPQGLSGLRRATIAMPCDTIREWLDNFPNLQVVGRNGMHRYNNQDHSMLTAMLAVKNILGESHDLWSVNVEQEYHEEAKSRTRQKPRARQYSERLQPERSWKKPDRCASRSPSSSRRTMLKRQSPSA